MKKNNRDRQGRFAEGNRGGPGRPKRVTEAEYLKALAGIVSLDDLRAIARRAVADAKKGSARAREWVSTYLLGVPAPRPHPGPDDRQRAVIEAVRSESPAGRGTPPAGDAPPAGQQCQPIAPADVNAGSTPTPLLETHDGGASHDRA